MNFWKAAAMGTTVVSNILLGLLIGWFLDSKLGSEPVCLVIGLLMGVLAALLWLFRLGKENV